LPELARARTRPPRVARRTPRATTRFAAQAPDPVCSGDMNSASNRAPGFRPARALAFLVGAHLWFTLLDATGKALAADMGAPLISLFRHAGQAALMLLVLAPSLGVRALLR